MKRTADTKKRKKINEKRLVAYTAAAGAAFLAAAPADAGIQYSGAVDVSLEGFMRVFAYKTPSFLTNYSGSSASIDIDGDGTDDLNFVNSPENFHSWQYIDHYYGSWYLRGGFSDLNGVSFAGGTGVASNLGAGSVIGASNNWTNNDGNLFFGNIMIVKSTSGNMGDRIKDSVNGGNFTLGNPGYLGIKFDPGDGTRYGWIHIASVEREDRFTVFDYVSANYKYVIDGWAYDDSGAPIAAGATSTPIVPEPTGMALFAAGAAAIMAKRRRVRNIN